MATEVRNNLVAANQNLQSTKANLKGIDLPYCSEDDFKTLQGLATGIYTDMQNVERQRYVLNIVQTMRKRCAALCQWIDQVIKDSIVVEYLKTKTDYETKSKALKIERTRMMQDKIKEKTGKDVNIKIHGKLLLLLTMNINHELNFAEEGKAFSPFFSFLFDTIDSILIS